MAARIDSGGKVYQLDRPVSPDENVSEADVQDVPKLTRLLLRILKDVATLKRRFWPKRIDFEDRTVDATGTTKYRLTHGFGGRVRYWVVEASGFSDAPNLLKDADTDSNTLVLTSTVAGTATIRVEQAG